MADAALGQLASAPVAAVAGSDELAAFRAGSGLPKVLLARAKATPTPLYRSLALRFKGRLAFATVRRPPGGRSRASPSKRSAGESFAALQWPQCAEPPVSMLPSLSYDRC
jgi:hypothetical protein